jgi:hypothetical protein
MKSARSRSGKNLTDAAVITSVAPEIARAAPRASATRLPFAKASLASGIAQTAVPKVEKVAAAPDQATVPESSAASRAPMERVDPRPKPPRIWPRARVLTVLFCRNSRPFSLTCPIYRSIGKLGFQQI